jgi:hypothetical protein
MTPRTPRPTMKKSWLCILAIPASILAFIVIVSFLLDEPLRRYAERRLNNSLKGFSVRIGRLAVHPMTLSVDVEDISIRQTAHPDQPVAVLPGIRGGLRWLALLTARITVDAEIKGPRLVIDREKLRPELERAPPAEEAWQDKLLSMIPLEIGELRVENGELLYVQDAQSRPLSVSGIQAVIRSLRNVRSPEGVYPSEIFLDAVLLGSGTVHIRGNADFLRKPVAGIKADFVLEQMNLAALRQMAVPHHIEIEQGTVSASGSLELEPPKKMILVLNELTLAGVRINYRYAVPAVEKQKGEKAKEAAQEVADEPGLLIKARRVRIADGSFGVVNTSAKPDYRVFMSDMDLEIMNFSNQFREGPAHVNLKGRFMGSGETNASATFRPEKKGADFTVKIAIKDTRMRTMNDLFRAYGNFDVSEGRFSLYSELAVQNNTVSGYVKPLFRDVKVLDKRTDREKSAFRKLYEGLIGGILNLFENVPREEIATETPISGTVKNPEAGTWAVLVNLVQNAFFQAILPGFEGSIEE